MESHIHLRLKNTFIPSERFITIQCRTPVVQVIPSHFCDCPGLLRHCHMTFRVLASPSAPPELSLVWQTSFYLLFLEEVWVWMLLFRKIWINCGKPKDEFRETAEVWKIWLMKTHQKYWVRRHWYANVDCLVIKKRINPFSCHLWEEQTTGSWNGGREIEIKLNKAQKYWKLKSMKYIPFQALQP